MPFRHYFGELHAHAAQQQDDRRRPLLPIFPQILVAGFHLAYGIYWWWDATPPTLRCSCTTAKWIAIAYTYYINTSFIAPRYDWLFLCAMPLPGNMPSWFIFVSYYTSYFQKDATASIYKAACSIATYVAEFRFSSSMGFFTWLSIWRCPPHRLAAADGFSAAYREHAFRRKPATQMIFLSPSLIRLIFRHYGTRRLYTLSALRFSESIITLYLI